MGCIVKKETNQYLENESKLQLYSEKQEEISLEDANDRIQELEDSMYKVIEMMKKFENHSREEVLEIIEGVL